MISWQRKLTEDLISHFTFSEFSYLSDAYSQSISLTVRFLAQLDGRILRDALQINNIQQIYILKICNISQIYNF